MLSSKAQEEQEYQRTTQLQQQQLHPRSASANGYFNNPNYGYPSYHDEFGSNPQLHHNQQPFHYSSWANFDDFGNATTHLAMAPRAASTSMLYDGGVGGIGGEIGGGGRDSQWGAASSDFEWIPPTGMDHSDAFWYMNEEVSVQSF